ncbi:MAG: sugar ABC transporter permease [Clostridia bacterium]|nr:sugar ABC transporter permease [Clostridia bacterium]
MQEGKAEKRENVFTRLFSKIKSIFLTIARSSAATKLSCCFMGVGQIVRKQIVKGIIYAALEVLFILFMVFFGGTYIARFLFSGHLGTVQEGSYWDDDKGIYETVPGDNSFLILLYGVVSLTVVVFFVTLWVMNVKGSLANDRLLAQGKRVNTFKQDCLLFINQKFYVPLLLPPLVGLLVFTVLPIIFMILIAFTNYDYQHLPPSKLFTWVGFANFGKLFSLAEGSGFLLVFLRVLLWTFVWAFIATFTNYFLGMLLALMINKKGIKLKMLWRTMFVIAIAVPQFITLLLMSKILDGDGILNKILGTTIYWLSDTRYASLLPRVVIILVNMWIGIPYTILMCSGILMNIPQEMYEAARLDGANAWQLFIKIVLPYMLHVTGPYLITQFVGNINNFNVIWLLTGGGPGDNILYGVGNAQSTDLLVTWLYRLTTDTNVQYNMASVIGIVIFVICASLSLITYNKTKATTNEEEFQ